MSHAEYMRAWRAARKPQRVPNLDWPTNVFGQPLKVEDLLAVSSVSALSTPKVNPEDFCKCGCGKPHRQNVTQTVHSAHGAGWHILYFWNEACKSRFNRARVAV